MNMNNFIGFGFNCKFAQILNLTDISLWCDGLGVSLWGVGCQWGVPLLTRGQTPGGGGTTPLTCEHEINNLCLVNGHKAVPFDVLEQ